MFILSGFEERKLDIFQACAMIAGACLNVSQPMAKYLKKPLIRFIAINGIISAYFSTSIYNSHFFIMLFKSHYPPRFENVEEIIDTNFDLISLTRFSVNI